MIKWLKDNLEKVEDKRVLVRASLNVPLSDSGNILNDFRIDKAVKTIKFLEKTAESIYIIAHIGRSSEDTLRPVYEHLKKYFPEIKFVEKEEYFTDKSAGIYLFENLRSFDGEVNNDNNFAQHLSELADIFVQDAFAVMHREHMSVVSLPKLLPSFGGLLLEKEIKALRRALRPKGESAFVLGGAKLSTKEPLLKKMLEVYDKVLIGGALANEALAARGYAVGESKIEDGKIDSEVLNHPHLFLPEKYTVESKDGQRKSNGQDIKEHEKIVDAFPPLSFLHGVKFLLWNGPLGWYERGYVQGSASLLSQIEIFNPKSYIGGGDSNAIVDELGKSDLFAFRSTGGGAMLKYLEEETLVGLEALS